MTLKIGLLVNPLAGIGGSVALKGSDGDDTVTEALKRGAIPQAPARATRAFAALPRSVRVLTWAGAMGEDSARAAGFEPEVIGSAQISRETHSQIATPETTPEITPITTPQDTRDAAKALMDAGVDILVFAGGDGTARDIVDAVGQRLPVLGIPAGCKMHSAVYALNPEAAGTLLLRLVHGEAASVQLADVRDIDESAFRDGVVRARHYGELRVPTDSALVQQVKCGGKEQEDLQVTEIAAYMADSLEDDVVYLMGSGSTVAELMAQLGLANTLLGVDAVCNGELIGSDLSAKEIDQLIEGKTARMVITVIGGQGHVFGRGNQQFSPEVIKQLGRENIIVLASRLKLSTLAGRPLIVDSGDVSLDQSLIGFLNVVAGYEDELLYPVATDASALSEII